MVDFGAAGNVNRRGPREISTEFAGDANAPVLTLISWPKLIVAENWSVESSTSTSKSWHGSAESASPPSMATVALVTQQGMRNERPQAPAAGRSIDSVASSAKGYEPLTVTLAPETLAVKGA